MTTTLFYGPNSFFMALTALLTPHRQFGPEIILRAYPSDSSVLSLTSLRALHPEHFCSFLLHAFQVDHTYRWGQFCCSPNPCHSLSLLLVLLANATVRPVASYAWWKEKGFSFLFSWSHKASGHPQGSWYFGGMLSVAHPARSKPHSLEMHV